MHLPLFNHHVQIVGACVFGVRVDIGVGVDTPDAAKVTLAPSFTDPLSSAAVTSDVGAGVAAATGGAEILVGLGVPLSPAAVTSDVGAGVAAAVGEAEILVGLGVPLSPAGVTSDVGAGEGGGTVVALVVTELEASLLVVVEMVPSVLVV